MASVALVAAGTAIGGESLFLAALLAGAGAAVGSFIDRRWTYPLLFGEPEGPSIQGPRLEDVQLQTAYEGAGINFCLGQKSRPAGNIIYIRPTLRETKHTESSGGGGKGGGSGGKSSSTWYTYSTDIAVIVCEGEIDSVVKIWGDAKLIYNVRGEVTFTDSTLSAEDKNIDGKGHLVITSGPAGPDLSQFATGHDVVVSGWTEVGNNGTFRCNKVEGSSGSTTKIWLRDHTATDELAGASVTLTQTPAGLYSRYADDITIHTGGASQAADSFLQSEQNAADTPAFRNRAYVVIENLQLADFGNRIPNFRFEVDQNGSALGCDEAISLIMQRHGFTTNDYDVSDCPTDEVIGYHVVGPKALNSQLEPILMAHDIRVRESGGKIHFFGKGEEGTFAIGSEDLAAHEDGSAPPSALTITDLDEHVLPKEVNISYLDEDNDCLRANQRWTRINPLGYGVDRVEIPIVMSGSDAKKIAIRAMWDAYRDRRTGAFTLPPSAFTVEETDIITVTDGNESWRVRVHEINRGNNHIADLRGVIEEADTFDFTPSAEDPDSTPDSGADPGSVLLAILDVGPLAEGHVSTPGLYFAASSFDQDDVWPGAGLYLSWDDVTYTYIQPKPVESDMGVTTGTLASAPTEYWDNVNTIQVEMFEGSLASVTEAECLNGSNRMWFGTGEIIGFKTVSSDGSNKYTLSGLLRGLRNSQDYTGSHEEGELAVVLEDGLLGFHEITFGQVGDTAYLKMVPIGGDIDEVEETEKTLAGRTCLCFSPCAEKAWWANGDLKVDWKRRSRTLGRIFNEDGMPMIPSVEEYEVDIFSDAGYATLERTITSTASANGSVITPTSQLMKYDSADITADGFSSTDTIYMKIYQIGSLLDRGTPETITAIVP